METNTDNQDNQQSQAVAVKNALEHRLDLLIAREDLNKRVEGRLKQMVRNVKLPGFRPGKAPLNIVRQQYGGQAHMDALNDSIGQAFDEALKTQQYRIAGQPRIEARESNSDAHMAFSAVFEVYPDVTIADVSTEKLKRPMLDVTPAEIDKTLEVLRKQRVRFEDADRAAQNGDRVEIDFTGRLDGEVFPGGQGTDYPFILGEGMMLADFESNVVGLSTGETKQFDLTFPENYVAELAGKTAQFEVVLKKVQAPVLPELDTEFAKLLGIADGDLDKMREEVETNLKREVKRRIHARIKDEAMDLLLRKHPIDVPRVLIDMEVERLMQTASDDLQARGIDPKGENLLKPEWFTERASRRVALGLIIVELVKAKSLSAKPDQVKAMVEDMAQSYENPGEVVRWYFAQRDRLAEIEALVLEDNVVDWVVENAQVEDVPIVFDELMGGAKIS